MSFSVSRMCLSDQLVVLELLSQGVGSVLVRVGAEDCIIHLACDDVGIHHSADHIKPDDVEDL